MNDLAWMRAHKLDKSVQYHPGLVVGICGGMQMLGHEITDPGGIEQQGRMDGLAMLPIRTSMQDRKVTRLGTGTVNSNSLFHQPLAQASIAGYEIHVGKTEYLDQAKSFATLASGELDGCVSTDGRILGTYLHGIFDDDCFRHQFVTAARAYHHLAPPSALNPWQSQRQESLDRLATQVSASLDMQQIFSWVGLR